MTTTTPAARRDPFTPISPEDESAALADRLDVWKRSYTPEPGYQEWVLARAVTATVRLDRNFAHESALRSYEAARAGLCWDDDRRLEAEELGAKIHKNPARVRKQLEASPQGADWLIERWDALGRIAGSGREWSEPQQAMALDMLGTPPALRDGPPPFGETAESQAALALAERRRLERLRERVLVPHDEHERSMAASGLSISFSPAMVRLHRDEAFWTREYHRAFNEFRRARPKPSDTAPEPEPEPEPSHSDPEPDGVDFAALDRMITAQIMKSRPDLLTAVAPPKPVSAPAPVSHGNRHDRRAQEARDRSQR